MNYKKLLIWIVSILILLVLIFIGLTRLGTRNGVTDAQVQESLPGDEIIPNPWITIDRAAVLPATAEQAWPWVQQLGKDRGGWYAPLWFENILKLHAASSTLPQYQNLVVGDVVPDWGGGTLKVLAIQSNSYVLYSSQHPAASSSNPAAAADSLGFTWLLMLENNTPSTTTFHLRLRIPRPPVLTGLARIFPPSIGGMIDYATDIVMFAGLKERLENHQ